MNGLKILIAIGNSQVLMTTRCIYIVIDQLAQTWGGKMAVHNLAAFTSSSAWLPPSQRLLSCHNNYGEDQSDNNDNE